jgi:hypothetical protein
MRLDRTVTLDFSPLKPPFYFLRFPHDGMDRTCPTIVQGSAILCGDAFDDSKRHARR